MPATTNEPRVQLTQEIKRARIETEALFSVLKRPYLYDRPISQRHRAIFYVGHLEAFDYLQICSEVGEKSREPQLDELFRAGIDPDSTGLPQDTPSDWPTLAQVERYVAQARERVDAALDDAPPDAAEMALEHRLMHLETLAYMWHNFDYQSKQRPENAPADHWTSAPPLNDWCLIPEGTASLGKPRDGSFGWDNEYNEHALPMPAFRVQRFNVTNGEYLQFVRDGAEIPYFWRERNRGLHLRCMFEEIPLPLDWPAYVTQREAEAYAAWMGKSLMTEAQYHRAAFGTAEDNGREYRWREDEAAAKPGNFDFRRWDPEPVQSSAEGTNAFGVRQLAANGWEWTATPFAPFKGFQPAKSYAGYSASFFDGQHYVMKGGSARTAARLLRPSFRNWFRADYPYVYAAFRCVEN